MPVQFPDGVYDYSHPWQSNAERVAGERAFGEDPIERRKIQVALACADPATPEAVITANLSVPGPPPRFGMSTRPPTIDDVFTRNLGFVNDYAPTNFSGAKGQYSGTSRP